MKVASQRIKMARVMAGLSMADLAKKTGYTVSKQAIGKYELGERNPPIKSLQAIAKAVNVKLDYFLRESKVDLGIINYRKQDLLPKKKQDEIKEKTRDYLERYLEAEELVGEMIEFNESNKKIVVKNYEAAEDIAKELRKNWQLGVNPIYNIVETLEERGIKVLRLKEKIKHFSGMSTWVNDKTPVIVLGYNPIDRIRFTALHELGHLLLDLEDYSVKAQEKICDRFAAAMLLPDDSLKSELGGHRKNIHLKELLLIKAQYGISPQAILYRCRELGLISEALFARHTKMIRAQGKWEEEIGKDVFKGKEESNRLFQLLCRGVSESFITTSKAASLYNKTVRSFRKELQEI